MPITSSDILFKLAVTTGSAGNSTAQADPNASLGKYVSTTQLTGATLANLFDAVSGDENAASDVEYRCLFVHNAHATLTLQSAVAWLSSETSGGAVAAIGLDPAGNVAVGSGADQAATVANESTAPTGVTFSAPTSKGTGLSIGNLAAGQVRAIWVRRTAANSAAVDVDGCVIRVEGDSAA